MLLVKQSISLSELKKMALGRFGNLVKAVVDTEKNLLVVDAEMHADEERFLLDQGSKQDSLWGVNLYPEKFGTADFIEFDSMINLRPLDNNLSRGVNNVSIREKIIQVVKQWIK